jgi:hypothetical protein
MLNFRVVAYKRGFVCKVDASEAFALKAQGKSLRQIRDVLAPDASVTAVWRAVKRAQSEAKAAA